MFWAVYYVQNGERHQERNNVNTHLAVDCAVKRHDSGSK